jgi:RNA polymerase sigma-B factor
MTRSVVQVLDGSAVQVRCRRGEEHAVFLRYRRLRRRADRDALVERFLPLARSLARRYAAGSEHEDVEQVAFLALVKAVERFDPANGAAFSSFATPTILGEIKRYFRDFGWMVRVPRDLQERALAVERAVERVGARIGRPATPGDVADELGLSVEEVVEALTSDSAHRPMSLEPPPAGEAPAVRPPSVEEAGFEQAEDGADMDALLGALSDTERAVVTLRFHGDLLQREIGELIGMSQMQVSRTLNRAIAQLRAAAADQR